MFINLATEYIILSLGSDEIIIPYENVEEHLTREVIHLYRTSLPSTIFVLNGPGSFTNLRVGALVANMVRMLSKEACHLQTIDKLTLYRYAYLQWCLPQHIHLFIGQRKNLRYYDLEAETYEVHKKTDPDLIERTDPSSWSQWEYAVDRFMDKDFEFLAAHPGMVKTTYHDGRIILSYGDESLDCTDIFVPTQEIEPFYGFESY